MESQPVGRRTRLQSAIKDNEMRQEKKRRWYTARTNWRNRHSRDDNIGVVNHNKVVYVKTEYDEENEKNQKDKDIVKDNRDEGGSDDSVQILGVRWNPDDCYQSHSSVSSSDSEGEILSTKTEVDCEKVSGLESSCNIGKDGEDNNEKDDVESKDEDNGKGKERVSSVGMFRKFEGLVLPKVPVNNATDNDFVARRTRSHFKTRVPKGKSRDGTFSRHVNIDNEMPSTSNLGKGKGNGRNTNSDENDSRRMRGRPPKTTGFENESGPEPEDEMGGDDVCKRKRGRPRKNRTVEKEFTPEEMVKTNEVEEGNSVREVLEPRLPLKFSFCVKNSVVKKSEEEEEIEGLFDDLKFSLRAFDNCCSIYGSDERKDGDTVSSYENVVVQAKLCGQGKHYLILDDEIGMRCKCCAFVKLEIRDVTPAFHNKPFGKSEAIWELPFEFF